MGKEEECGDGVRKLLFGRYEMGRVLGQGTFGKVYHVRDLRTGDSVAVKVINKDHVRREARMADQIQREITVMRLVRHPHVVELKEVLATRCRIYFVMEYVRGGELFARVARGRLPEDQARCYFHQLISAVDFCHSRGVSHRDLKPENLLLDEEGNLKVSDFGLSALPEQLRHDGLLHTQCGTPAYVAPEVLRKKGYDGAASDLWSCGVILFVLLAGFLPFQDKNLMRMYRKVFKAEYQTPPWFSSDGRRLVSRLLVADPAKRISIPAIMQHAWFKRGPSLPPLRYLPAPPSPLPPPDDGAILTDEEKAEDKGSPRFHNAFELIATVSLGFNLSGLFESGRKSRTVFTSRAGAETIVERLEAVGKKLGFEVQRANGGCSVHMEKRSEGPKGWLAVTAEVCEVAPQVAFVVLRKSSGDTLEYAKFCEEDVRPGIQDIVWTWKGDDTSGDRRETT